VEAAVFQVGRRQTREQGRSVVLELDQLNAIVQAATVMRAAANHLNMVACAAAAKDLGNCFQRLPPPQQGVFVFGERHLDDLIGGLEYFLRTFRDEIDARPLFAMSPTNAEL
jgi:hypothetical protein